MRISDWSSDVCSSDLTGRMNSPNRLFCCAGTCSILARIADFAALARAVAVGMDFHLALRRWMRLVSIRSASHVSFVLERYAVSAQTLLLLFTAITGVTCAHRRAPPR